MSAPPFPCETEDNDVCWPCEMLTADLRDLGAMDLTRTLPTNIIYHAWDPAYWQEPGRLVSIPPPPPPCSVYFEGEAPF